MTSYTIPSEAGLDAKLTVNAAADRARANHTGTQSADTLTDGTTNKAYTATEKTKLAGIATAATANRTDAATDTLLGAKADLVGGLVPTSQIPAIALTNAVTVASQAAMLALTTTQVQPGDVAVRTDGTGTFILTATDPTQLGNWVRLNAPTDAVTTVNGQAGTVVLAKTDVGLGNVDNTSDVNKPVSAATGTAIGNSTINQPVNVISANGTAVIGARNAVNASAGPIAVTLPAPTAVGQHIIIERSDTSTVTANTITITGTIRGVANTVVTLAAVGAANEGGHYIAESLTSWAIAGSIKPKLVLDAYYGGKTAVTVDGAYVPTLDIASTALIPSTPSIQDTFSLAAVNYDPLSASATTAENTGIGYLARIHLDKAATISNVNYAVGTAITGATTGNLIGLYDDNGVQQAVTGELGATWASTGLKTSAFGTPVALQPGWYYLMLITNGTTGVGLYRAGSTAIQNIGLDGTATKRYRFGTYGTAQTTLPASLTMASIATGTTLLTLWFGLS